MRKRQRQEEEGKDKGGYCIVPSLKPGVEESGWRGWKGSSADDEGKKRVESRKKERDEGVDESEIGGQGS